MFSPWSSPVTSGGHSSRVRWHWVLQACAAGSAYTGLAVITVNKYLNSYGHYTSWHRTVGVLLCGVVALQIAGGIGLQDPELLPFKVRRVLLKRMHAVSGTVTYFGGLTTVFLALYSGWFVANVPNSTVWGASAAVLAVQAAYVLVQIARNHVIPMFKRM